MKAKMLRGVPLRASVLVIIGALKEQGQYDARVFSSPRVDGFLSAARFLMELIRLQSGKERPA